MFVDRKYALILGNRLGRFTVKSDGGRFLAEFRCPICGDSQKSTSKKRGYLYDGLDRVSLVYKCHNCGITCSFEHFLDMVDPGLYKEYKFEKIRLKVEETPDFQEELKSTLDLSTHIEILGKLKPVTTLPEDHACIKYIQNRKIPEKQWYRLYYTENFMQLVNEYKPGKHKEVEKDERLVIPFFTENGKDVFMLQGRAIYDTKMRYLSLRLNDGHGNLYGLECVKKTRDIFVTEGPIDSLFLDNAVAMATSSVDVTRFLPKDKIVMVMDNEPRNKDIVKLVAKHVEKGLRVVIWPDNISEKDINMMAISGIDYKRVIHDNIYHGLKAKLKLTQWRKV